LPAHETTGSNSSTQIINATYAGNNAQDQREILNVRNPIHRGVITNWDDMEKIWQHTLDKSLGAELGAQPVLLTESPTNCTSNRQKMAQIMLERFQVPYFFLSNQAVLGLYAAGRGSGVVLASGEGITHAVPVFEGYCLRHAITQVDIAGSDLTDYLSKLLHQRGVSDFDRATVNRLKETRCRVALDFDLRMQDLSSNNADPADGLITAAESYRCPEALFNPSTMGMETKGIHEAVYESIMKCDADLRRPLFLTVVLSGGNTLFPGLLDRMNRELTALAPSGTRIKVISPAESENLTWQGGSILASIPSFQDMSISRLEYEETGSFSSLQWKSASYFSPCLAHVEPFFQVHPLST
jgi:actin, other eukaryote